MLEQLLPVNFSDDSRVWIFQGSRRFIDREQIEIIEQLNQFYEQWTTHGKAVHGWAGLLFGQFIIVMADESGTHVSGCSTDGMMRVVKSLERQYSVNFFERTMLTFLVRGQAEMLPAQQVRYALEKGHITPDTLVFNNTPTTKRALLTEWVVPLHQSWLRQKPELAGLLQAERS